MGGVFNAVKKIASIALPVAVTALTGGAAAPLTLGSIASSVGRSLAINAITGAISGGGKKQSAQPQQQAAAAAPAADPADAAAKAEDEARKKRLALNAQGSSGNTTSPLGVTGSANVTKRNLLGL